MAIVISSQRLNSVKALSALQCIIGQTYRRESQPTKLYLCCRDHTNPDNKVMVSLSHGNPVKNGLGTPDFLPVNLEVTVYDA